MKFLLASLVVCALILAVWFSPPVQKWKNGRVEVAIQQHWEESHLGAHDHGFDQVWFPPGTEIDTLFVDRAGRTVFRVGSDTIRINLEELPDDRFGHEHFGLGDTLGAALSAALEDDHLMDKLLDHANTLAVIITVLGTASANVYWKFKKGNA